MVGFALRLWSLSAILTSMRSLPALILGALSFIGGRSALVAGDEVNPPMSPSDDQVVAIVGARLIDGLGGPPRERSVVVVRGTHIVQIGYVGEVAWPRDAQVVQAAGASLLPGLVDSHFHSRYDLERPVTFELNHGITSFRDPGHPMRFYDPVKSATISLPRVFLCGAHLDGPPPVWPEQAVVIESAEEARRTVHAHVDQGASAIKVYFRLELEHIRAACEAARERGVPVTAHLELVDVPDAIAAGVRGIEHVTSFGTTLASSENVRRFKDAVRADSSARRELRHWLWSTIKLKNNLSLPRLLDLLRQHDVTVSPTLAIFERRAGEKGGTAEQAAAFDNMKRFIGMCHEAGVRIVVGSHTSAPFAARGRAYQRELELLEECGITPAEILQAATFETARFLGIGDRLGTIETGKLADLVLVEGDPIADLKAMESVQRVMLNGRWIKIEPQR